MSFSTVTYDTRRAERIAEEQREKQEKLAILNNKIAKIDKIKQEHEQLVVDRQKRRLSEMQPPTHIGGYSSFNSASISPKNSMKASLGTFGSAAKSTATPPKSVASDSQPSGSPATPTVKKQPRRRTVTIQELEKIQQLIGPNPINVARKAKARASVAVKLNASRRASSFSRLSTGTPVNTNSNGRKQITAHSFSERKPHNIQSKSAKAVNTVGSSSNGPRRSSAFVRRTPKTGITSAKVKRGSFSLGRNSDIARRPSTYIPSKLQPDFRSVSVESVSRSISKEKSPMQVDDVNRLRQHAVSKAISYENLGVTERKRRTSTKMTEMERMQFRLKESYELIDKLSEQLIPYLQESELTGITPKKNLNKSTGSNPESTKKGSKSAVGGQTPSYRIIEIRSLRKRVSVLEDAVLQKERQINHWRNTAEKLQQDRGGMTITEEIKQQEMSGKLEEVESQNREMIKLMDDLNDRLEDKEHEIKALASQLKV